MAYQQKNLSALSYANGFTLWHYRTSDSFADIDTAGYFDDAVRMFRVGDFVLLNAGVGVAPANGVSVVTGNTGSAVTVANMVALGALRSS